MGFPGGSEVEASACIAGDLGSIPGLGRSPGGGHGNPLQYSCLENPCGGRNRNMAGYSPWGHKESDTTERLSTRAHVCVYIIFKNLSVAVLGLCCCLGFSLVAVSRGCSSCSV